MAGRKKGWSPNEEEIAGEIKKKAFELYEESGRKPGRELENWLEAERRVKQMLKA
jgi:hypothetical protein